MKLALGSRVQLKVRPLTGRGWIESDSTRGAEFWRVRFEDGTVRTVAERDLAPYVERDAD